MHVCMCICMDGCMCLLLHVWLHIDERACTKNARKVASVVAASLSSPSTSPVVASSSSAAASSSLPSQASASLPSSSSPLSADGHSESPVIGLGADSDLEQPPVSAPPVAQAPPQPERSAVVANVGRVNPLLARRESMGGAGGRGIVPPRRVTGSVRRTASAGAVPEKGHNALLDAFKNKNPLSRPLHHLAPRLLLCRGKD